MLKSKILTKEDVELLISEDWLTNYEQQALGIHEGELKSIEDIEDVCPDLTVLNMIFEQTGNICKWNQHKQNL